MSDDIASGRNPLYCAREDAADAIADHLAEDDSAYQDREEAERQAIRIIDAIERRGLRVVHSEDGREAAAEITRLRARVAKLEGAGKRFLDHHTPQYEPPGAPEITENLDRYDCDPLAVAEFSAALAEEGEAG